MTGDQYPYALLLLMRLLGPWIHSGDPVTPLLLTRDLDRLRAEVAAGPFFQNLIRRQFLDNPHRVTLTLKPDPERKVREDKEVADNLQALAARLTPEQKQQIVEQAQELQEAQEMEEDLSVLPTLELSDIPAEESPVPSREEKIEGVALSWFVHPTNGIVYFSAQSEGAHIPRRSAGFSPPCLSASLFPHIWGRLAVGGFSGGRGRGGSPPLCSRAASSSPALCIHRPMPLPTSFAPRDASLVTFVGRRRFPCPPPLTLI